MAHAATMRTTAIWTDRFSQPSPESLIQGVPSALSGPIEAAMDKLRTLPGIQEMVLWQGVWHWTIAYRHEADASRCMAYLIADPNKPRLCIPVPSELVPLLPIRKLSRFVRDGILHAPAVGTIRWSCWPLTLKSQVDELMVLMQDRLTPPQPTPKN